MDFALALSQRSMPKMLEEIDRNPYLPYTPIRGLPPLVAACSYGCDAAMLTKLAHLGGSLPPCEEALPALAGGPSAILDDGVEDANDERRRMLSASCLLQAGANPEARDASGRDAADVARQAGRPLLAELITHYEDVQTCKVLRSIRSKSRQGSADSSEVLSMVLPGVLLVPEEIMQRVYGLLAPELNIPSARPCSETPGRRHPRRRSSPSSRTMMAEPMAAWPPAAWPVQGLGLFSDRWARSSVAQLDDDENMAPQVSWLQAPEQLIDHRTLRGSLPEALPPLGAQWDSFLSFWEAGAG